MTRSHRHLTSALREFAGAARRSANGAPRSRLLWAELDAGSRPFVWDGDEEARVTALVAELVPAVRSSGYEGRWERERRCMSRLTTAGQEPSG